MSSAEPRITKETVIAASWELMGRVGIDDFSMRKLAVELNIQAPSLYWYFSNKQAILQTLANEVARECLLSTVAEGTWKDQLTQIGVSMRAVLGRYPCSPQLMMRTVPTNADYLGLINKLLEVIEVLPLDDSRKFSSVTCILNYIIAFELDKHEQRATRLLLKEMGGPLDTQALFKEPLERLAEDEAPVLKRLYRDGVLAKTGSTQMFDNGLQIIVAGIEQLATDDGRRR